LVSSNVYIAMCYIGADGKKMYNRKKSCLYFYMYAQDLPH